jgi:hypothetical protein
MTVVQVVESIKADAKLVWDILGDFGGVKVGGPVTAFEVTGEGVGAVRTITMSGALIVERLESYDPDNLTFSYAIINEDCPLPVSEYSATVKIIADEDGCTVHWTGNFEPKGQPEEQAMELVRGIYTGAIAGARNALDG